MKRHCSHEQTEMIDSIIKPMESALQGFIVGQSNPVHHVLLALLAVGQRDFNVSERKAFLGCGHVLLIGPTGTGKTILCKMLASLIKGKYKRVQGAPDLLASDVTGFELLSLRKDDNETLKFREGPVFANILLVDEINRIPPKAASGFLEGMAEGTVTNVNQTYPLPDPFLCLGTMNPSEQSGTFSLNEAISDRFMFCCLMNRTTAEQRKEIVHKTDKIDEIKFDPVTDVQAIGEARIFIHRQIGISDPVLNYIVRVIEAVNDPKMFGLFIGEQQEIGARAELFCQDPPLNDRTTIFLCGAAKAQAAIDYRDHVTYDDVRRILPATLRSRLGLVTEGALFSLVSKDGDLMYSSKQDLVNGLVKQVLERVPII